MKWKDILFVLGLSAVLGACEKKDIEVFTTDDAGIYFQLIKGYYGTTTEIYTDSLDYITSGLDERCDSSRYRPDDGEGGGSGSPVQGGRG